MDSEVQKKLVEMEKRYLLEALKKCGKCYDSAVKDDCSQKCSEQYINFMKVREFYLEKQKSVRMKDVKRL